MINRKFLSILPYVHLFIERLLKEGIDVKTAALYGSCLTEDFTTNSDIDIAIAVANRKEIEKTKLIEEEVSKKMMEDGFRNYLHVLADVGTVPEYATEGILIFGKPVVVETGGKELIEEAVITYDTSSLQKKKRVSLAISLFGQKLKRGTKVYVNEGMVANVHGKKLKNAIIVGRADALQVAAILEKFGIPHSVAYIYSEKTNKYVER